MNDKKRDGYLDDLLDRSLARYGRVEPRQGLEERLLIQVRSAKQVQKRKSRWVWYLAPAAVAAAALLFMVIPWKDSEPAHSGTPVAAAEPPAVGIPPVETAVKPSAAQVAPSAGGASLVDAIAKQPVSTRALSGAHSASSVAVKKRARPVVLTAETSRPRRDIFPTPEPLSEVDRLLLRLMQSNGSAFDQLLAKLPTADQALEKIQIAELKIPVLMLEPITSPSLEPEK